MSDGSLVAVHSWMRNAAVVAVAVVVATAACSTPRSGARTAPPTSATPSSATATPSESTPSESTPSATPSKGLRGLVIVVDPGHNGGNASHPEQVNKPVDAGGLRKPCNTTGTQTTDGYSEHAFNWDVAKRLVKLLRADGATVVLTRKNDKGVGPCVDERGKTAVRHHADLLVSIHADGSAPGEHGFAVLRPAKVPGYTTKTYQRSKLLADDVVDAFTEHGFTRSTYLGKHGIDRRSDLGTLNLAGAPAVMLEAGNMRNVRDARMLSSAKGRQRVAVAFAAGVAAFSQRG